MQAATQSAPMRTVANIVAPPAEPPVNILVVDDYPENRAALRAILASPDYRLVEAGSAREALRLLLKDEFAVLLIDVMMPEMNGFELATTIKQREQTAGIPVLFVTATATDLDFIYNGYRVGAVDYLLKPLVPEMVRAKVSVFAELHRKAKRLEHQAATLSEFKSSLDAVLDAVVIFDANDWRFQYVNQGASALLGYSVEELRDMRPVDFMAEHGAGGLRELVATVRGGSKHVITIETQFRRRDTQAVPVEVSLQYIPIAGGRVVAIARNITDRQQAQLERELLYRRAVEALRARDEFLAVAAHDLRTPLSSLKLQVDRLLRDPGDEPTARAPAQWHAGLQVVGRQVDRLSRLIAQLMDVSQLSAGRLRLELEEIDVAALAREVAEGLGENATKAKSPIWVDAPAPVVGRWDRIRVEQVLMNLIGNALKFGAGKPIELTVTEDGPIGRIVVRDHGMGIAHEDADRIFHRYEQAAAARSYGGLGLGLFISRLLIEAHGGTIRVESQLEAGATFIVELPREPPVR